MSKKANNSVSEKSIKLSPKRVEAIIENAFDGIIMESTRESIYAVNRKFNYIAFNKNHARIMKLIYGAKILVGENAPGYLKGTPEYHWLRKELMKAAEGKLLISEHHLDQQQYRDRYIETTYNPIFDKKNRVVGVAVFVRDITQRKKSEEKLRILNDGLTSQNWQLAIQEEELKATLEELSERNFELDQLMYKTSHDLRSPLSSILGLINLAHLDGNKENFPIYLNKIEGRVKKLDEFIRSMLNYARVNRSEIFVEKINLRDVIMNSIHELEYLENFSSVKTQITFKSEATFFKCDALRIKIIMSNIISNAYKYYNATVNSYLKINVNITPLTVSMTFQDNGIGIRKEHLSKVFNMFYRATEKSQGSGLGMYIVKQAIDKLKGTITIKSIFGKGTIIKIVLPNN